LLELSLNGCKRALLWLLVWPMFWKFGMHLDSKYADNVESLSPSNSDQQLSTSIFKTRD
jgi:hypothetical protein